MSSEQNPTLPVLLIAQSSSLIAGSPLSLFMFRVHADHAHHALAVDDLALVANLLNRCSYLHNSLSHAAGLRPGRTAEAAVST